MSDATGKTIEVSEAKKMYDETKLELNIGNLAANGFLIETELCKDENGTSCIIKKHEKEIADICALLHKQGWFIHFVTEIGSPEVNYIVDPKIFTVDINISMPQRTVRSLISPDQTQSYPLYKLTLLDLRDVASLYLIPKAMTTTTAQSL
jgi:hypothetical protein